MPNVTLKALHSYLRLLENPAELKRRMPGFSSARTVWEGLLEISKLLGIDPAVFKDPQVVGSMIGPQRFTIIGGEPSVTQHVGRIFDNTKVLFSVFIDPGMDKPAATPMSAPAAHGQPAAKSHSASWTQLGGDSPTGNAQANITQETALQSLNPLLAGNPTLTCRLFRVMFEHLLAFTAQNTGPQDNAMLVNELTGSREHGKSFMASAMYILGNELDPDNLMPFLLEQRLYGLHIFEQLLHGRDYCAAYFNYRHMEKAFLALPAEEETRIRTKLNQFIAQFNGKPCESAIFLPNEEDKARVDAHAAALDILESMALTPLYLIFKNAVEIDSLNCVRSVKIVASLFERFAHGEQNREQTNHAITDHLLAFARQFAK